MVDVFLKRLGISGQRLNALKYIILIVKYARGVWEVIKIFVGYIE